MHKYRQLKALLESLQSDLDKFYYKKNASAAIRLRKACQEIKILTQGLREDIGERNNKNKKERHDNKRNK